MVSVTSPDELLLGDAQSILQRELMLLSGKKNLEEAFSAWLLGDTQIPFQLSETAILVAEHVGGQRRYQDVAILGFAAASNYLQEIHRQALREGLIWISGREPLLDGRLQGFCIDVVALLGIALGAKALDDDIATALLHEWVSKFIQHSFQSRLEDWQICLLIAVCQIVGVNVQKAIPETSDLADIRVSLYSKGALEYLSPDQEKDRLDALFLMKRGFNSGINSYRAALRLAAFELIQSSAPSANLVCPTVGDIVRILNRVPAAFRRWTWEDRARTSRGSARKWYIDNEYHVQNFLYFLLAPIFPDLKEEEYTPSVGPMHPRADLGIPSLGVIIEVKFMRSTHTPQKMIEQISADCGLYLVDGSPYHQIISFIWDDSRSSQEYDCMRDGLMQLRGVVESVIVARPGNLTE
jgi:hypothetical protein